LTAGKEDIEDLECQADRS